MVANGNLTYPKNRSARIGSPKCRPPWGSGQWLQRHKALAIKVIVVLFERCKGSVEKTHKRNGWKCGTC